MDGLPDPREITAQEALEAFNQRRAELDRLHQDDPYSALMAAEQAVEWATDVIENQSDDVSSVPLQMNVAALSSDLAFVAIESGQFDAARRYVYQAANAIAAAQGKLEKYENSLEPCWHGNLSYRGRCTSICPPRT